MIGSAMPITFLSCTRVTYEQSRQQEAEYWAAKTMAERVIAGWELADEKLVDLTGHEPQKPTGIAFFRVPQSWR